MQHYNNGASKRKSDYELVDADDLAILTLVRKFGLTRSTARVLACHAGLGGDRTAASGGRST